MKKLLALLLCMLLCVPASLAETAEDFLVCGDFAYVLLPDGSAQIIDYIGAADVLSIPAEVNGAPVSALGDMLFYRCDQLISITIPDSVTTLGVNPFAYCRSLQEIKVSLDHPTLTVIDGVLFEKSSKTLVCYPFALAGQAYAVPEGIRTIGAYAFYSLPELSSVTLPESLEAIGDQAFADCKALAALSIPAGVSRVGSNPFATCRALTEIRLEGTNPALQMVDGMLITTSDMRLVTCLLNGRTACTVPDGVRIIGDQAFQRCVNLAAVTLPDSVTEIASQAFYWCHALRDVNWPAQLQSIGNQAFLGCYSLTRMTLPEGLRTIGKEAFQHCILLEEAVLPATVESIGSDAFSGCAATLTLAAPRDSYAAQWMKESGLAWTYTDANAWLTE